MGTRTEAASKAAKARWARTEPAERAKNTAAMQAASKARRRRAEAVYDALLAAGIRVDIPDEDGCGS